MELYKEAISDFNKALEINSSLADAYYHRAMAYAELNEKQYCFLDLYNALPVISVTPDGGGICTLGSTPGAARCGVVGTWSMEWEINGHTSFVFIECFCRFIKILLMKKLLFIFALIILSLSSNAQNYIQKYNNYLNRTEFYDSYGNMVGYAKVNTYLDRTEYFDSYGNMVKYVKNNSYLDRQDTYDQNGNQQGYQKNNSYLNRKESYDNNGNQQGYKKWNEYLQRYDVYDANSNQVGYYKYNSYMQRWEYTSTRY